MTQPFGEPGKKPKTPAEMLTVMCDDFEMDLITTPVGALLNGVIEESGASGTPLTYADLHSIARSFYILGGSKVIERIQAGTLLY